MELGQGGCESRAADVDAFCRVNMSDALI